MKNLVEDPAKQPLVKEMDERLAAVMKETGDSWDMRVVTSDQSNWEPGGRQAWNQKLGGAFPGRQEPPAKESGEALATEGKKDKRRTAGKGTGAEDDD